jgi:hypothetical protein
MRPASAEAYSRLFVMRTSVRSAAECVTAHYAGGIRGIVLAWSCRECRAGASDGGREYAPGRWSLGPMHTSHVPELVALGRQVTTYAGQPPDVVCPHYAALCAAAVESPGPDAA